MQNKSDVQTIEQKTKGQGVLDRLLIGEVHILSLMTKAPSHAALRARLKRNCEKSIIAGEDLIQTREGLIAKYQMQES
ncbi:MAG: hypothetical protein ACPGSD_07915 [Flavobacteriales bacterium]